jgi:G protein-coupled receptor GPR1
MIAIHSALYIIKPKNSGEGGLYPYRHIAYAIWVALPLTMASLAFVRKDNPYVGDGAYCYLPLRPLWYSMALSWGPRYLIFIIILGVYAFIYSYVRYKFSGFTKLSKKTSMPPNDKSWPATKQQAFSSLPPLIYDGSTSDSRSTSGAETERRTQSVSTTVSYDQVPISPEPNAHQFMWASFLSRKGSTQIQPPSPKERRTNLMPLSIANGIDQSLPQNITNTLVPPINQGLHLALPSRPDAVQQGSHRRHSSRRSMVDIFTLLSQRPCETETLAPSSLQLVNSRGPNVAVSDMIRTRDKIRRQLRYLFIYPLAYVGMWLMPFIVQVLQYDDRFAANLPFGLRCVTTICLCSQAAIDCWLFSSREKPWRHIPGTDGSFISSLRFWSGWKDSSELKEAPGPGRTKDQVVREARAAYRRRDEELAQRRSESEQSGFATTRGGRMWWDGMGMETAMTPVSEEVTNPMDTILAADPPSPDLSPRTTEIRRPGLIRQTERFGGTRLMTNS